MLHKNIVADLRLSLNHSLEKNFVCLVMNTSVILCVHGESLKFLLRELGFGVRKAVWEAVRLA